MSAKNAEVDVQIGEPEMLIYKPKKKDNKQLAQEVLDRVAKAADTSDVAVTGTPAEALRTGAAEDDKALARQVLTKVLPKFDTSDVRVTGTPAEALKSTFVDISKDGKNVVRIPRGDMSDKEWAQFHRSAKDKGVAVQIGEPQIERPERVAVQVGEPQDMVRTPESVAARDSKREGWWMPEGAVAERPSGSGGGFLSNVRSMVSGALPQAVPSGAGGGGGSSGAEGGAGGQGAPSGYRPSFGEDVQNAIQTGNDIGRDLGNVFTGGLASTITGGPSFGDRVEQTGNAAGGLVGPRAEPPPLVPLPPATQNTGIATPWNNPPPTAAPSGPSVPAGPGMPASREGEIQAATKDQVAAIKGAGEIQSALESEKGRLAQQRQDEIVRQQAKIQQQQEFMAGESKKLYDSTAAAQQVLNSPSQTPDPERYWKNHSKIMFAIGVGMLAQAGRDIGGVLSSVNQAIDRDIEAQKAEFEAPKKAAQAKIAGNNTLYGMLRQQGQDAFEATKTAQALSNDFYANQLERLAANSNSQLVKQNAAMKSAELRASAAQKMQEADAHRGALSVQRYNAQTNRMEANAKMQSAGASGPAKLNSTEQSKILDVDNATRNIRDNLAIARDIIARKGTFELTGTDQAELERALGDVAQDSARMKDPGSTVKEGELALAKKAIGVHGGEIFSLTNKNALKLLDSYEKTIEKRREEAFRTRGLEAPSSGSSSGGGRMMRLPSGETVLVR